LQDGRTVLERTSAGDQTYVIGFWILTGLLSILSLYLSLWGGLELAPDEAYYWVWAGHLDWCYFSKGPGIAALIRMGALLAGDNVLGVRLPAIVCGLVTGITMFYWLRAASGSARIAFWSVAALASAPIMTAGRVVSTIDVPLFMFWGLAVAVLWRLSSKGGSSRLWLLLGLIIGVGSLVKFTMLFFLVSAVVAVVLLPGMRVSVRKAGFWLMFPIVGACLVPVLLWNVRHDWVTFAHTIHKADSGMKGWGGIRSFASSLGLQAAVTGPLTFLLLAWSVGCMSLKAFRERTRLAVILAAGWLPVFAFYGILAWKRSVAGNWPVVGYFTAFPAVAIVFVGRGRPRWRGKALLIAVAASCVLQLPFLAGDMLYRVGVPALSRLDQTNRLRGWEELAVRVRSEARKLSQAGGVEPVVIAHSYQVTSELRFYMRSGPKAICTPRKRAGSHYDLLPAEHIPPGADAIIVEKAPRKIRSAFEKLEVLNPFLLQRSGVTVKKVRLYRARNFRGWPP